MGHIAVFARTWTEHHPPPNRATALDVKSTLTFAGALSFSLACAPTTPPLAPLEAEAPPPTTVQPAPSAPTAPIGPDDARGGRLYDNWRSEKGLETFKPDSAKTPELDGAGGPNGNGTLNDQEGKPIPNTGHDYRLKNLFGWDLRGAQGIYGAAFQNKSYVLGHNLLSDTRSAEELRSWLAQGGPGVPAFGAVLDDRDLDDLVAFLVKTRARELVTPELVFRLDEAAPKGFTLLVGGDAARGKQYYAERCAGCHGDDGREFAIDDVESVGTLSRSSGYEIWFKLAHGQPGTEMGRQLQQTGGAAQAQEALDLLAALCDRSAFPAPANGEDVPDGDARCGGYLR
jgi:mono/diheme cytochrome c family protein